MGNPSSTKAWTDLLSHSHQFKDAAFHLHSLFDNNEQRHSEFSLQHEKILLDYSKNFLTQETRSLLLELAWEQQVPAAITAMFAGDKINFSEGRAALHTALRRPAEENRNSEIEQTLEKVGNFVSDVHDGIWRGYSDKAISDVVNIGIGGSDLGPAFVCDALSHFSAATPRVHFVSNVDPSHLQTTLAAMNPETTLFIIASKSFTTLETHQNAVAARRWLLSNGGETGASKDRIDKHFIAITSNENAAQKFGIAAENLFPLWDWVGGRYSLWSAIGLPIALSVGMDNFRQLLAGAHSMDEHFRTSELQDNMPVMMALLSLWYSNFFDCQSSAVIPYSQRLALLPSYLQQLSMESLGKSSNIDGEAVSTSTGEVLWGTAGSNGQHSYFQLLHQGTGLIPVDFIAFAKSSVQGSEQQHQHLLANCFSQSLALMQGKQDEQNLHRNVLGNKPSNTLLVQELTPYNLGSLIALFEHKVYVLSILWNINAFDQWGVELGKDLSSEVFTQFDARESASGIDDSTLNLIRQTKKWQS